MDRYNQIVKGFRKRDIVDVNGNKKNRIHSKKSRFHSYRDNSIKFSPAPQDLELTAITRICDPFYTDRNDLHGVNISTGYGTYKAETLISPRDDYDSIKLVHSDKMERGYNIPIFCFELSVPSGICCICSVKRFNNEIFAQELLSDIDEDAIDFIEMKENPFRYSCETLLNANKGKPVFKKDIIILPVGNMKETIEIHGTLSPLRSTRFFDSLYFVMAEKSESENNFNLVKRAVEQANSDIKKENV